jgi:hypothetical protein
MCLLLQYVINLEQAAITSTLADLDSVRKCVFLRSEQITRRIDPWKLMIAYKMPLPAGEPIPAQKSQPGAAQ